MITSPYDGVFGRVTRLFDLPPLLINAVARVESSWRERAYRYEPVYWDMYMKDKPQWAGRDPKEVSASYGLCQILFDVGLRYYPELKRGEELYDPELNCEIAAQYLSEIKVECEENEFVKKFNIDPWHATLARYNGGPRRNPGLDGKLRNQTYVDKVTTALREISR